MTSLDAYYRQASPQLLARVRQMWSARGLDLDRVWRATIRDLPGFRAIDPIPPFSASRPVDLALLFDQAASWIQCLGTASEAALRDAATGARTSLTVDQLRSLVVILARLKEEIAAVRALALAGLATPAMQIIRSISEDVDMALVMLLRPKVARQFAECRSPEEAGDFWRRHIAGGRAFRAVAEQLYRVGLDYSEDSTYARWRKEVQVLLGAAVHTSYLGGAAAQTVTANPGQTRGLSPAAQECLYFATLRIQEMCIYSHMLGQALRSDLDACLARATEPTDLLPMMRVAVDGSEIILDQMRWLTSAGVADEPGAELVAVTPPRSVGRSSTHFLRAGAELVLGDPARRQDQRTHREVLAVGGHHLLGQLGELGERTGPCSLPRRSAWLAWRSPVVGAHLNMCGGKLTIAATPSAVPTARWAPSGDHASAPTAPVPSGRSMSSSRRPTCRTLSRPLA